MASTRYGGACLPVCNPSIQKAEATGSRILGQLELHSETLSQKQKLSQVLLAYTCNPSYSGGRDQED
jgi:hypothetical protein